MGQGRHGQPIAHPRHHSAERETITKWGLHAFMLAGHDSQSWYAGWSMSGPSSIIEVYQLRVGLCGISPLIWRRLLVRSDSPIAAPCQTVQIARGWDDAHLHRVRIHGKGYGISRGDGVVRGPGLRRQQHVGTGHIPG
jgi:Plasmid pRiA4b ORF-3-like protein